MRVTLFEDIETNRFFTYEEIKSAYSTNRLDTVTDEEVQQFIHNRAIQSGGCIKEIYENEDEILEWCNDYIEYSGLEYYVSDLEVEVATKKLYQSVLAYANGNQDFKDTIYNLFCEAVSDFKAELLLDKLLEVLFRYRY